MDDEESNLEAGTKGAEGVTLGRTISSDRDLLLAIMDFYARNPNVIGGGDILTITGSTPAARAGMVAASLAGIVTEGDERAIRRVVVVIPPGGDVAEADGLVWSSFVQSFELLARRPLRQDEEAWFRDRLIVHIAPNGRHATLIELVAEQVERTALIVVEAAGYRDDTIASFVPSGARTALIPEDVWVPQVHALAVATVPLALERKLYVVLDINESSPIRPELGDLLLSVEAFGEMGSMADEPVARQPGLAWHHLRGWGRTKDRQARLRFFRSAGRWNRRRRYR